MAKINEEDADNTKEIVNISQNVVKFEIAGTRFVMKPGDRRFIHKNYATARAMQPNRDPVPSTIELLTNKMVLPIDHPKMPENFLSAEQKTEKKARLAAAQQAQASG